MEEVYIKSEKIEIDVKLETCESEHDDIVEPVKCEQTLIEPTNYDNHNYNSEIMCNQQFYNQELHKNTFIGPGIDPTAFQINQHIPNPLVFQGPSENASNSNIHVIGKVYENGRINRLNCNQCNKTYKNRANLKNHIKYVHCDEQNIECTECFRTFKSILYLRSHMSSVHAKTEQVECEHCHKIFMNKKKLNNHIYYTHRQPEEQVSCKICSKTYKSHYNLKVHMRYVHPEGDPHPCPICYKTFKVEMLLQRHLKWAHPNDGLIYKCHDCNKILPSMECYKSHLTNVHDFVRATCDICKKTYKTKKSLERHLKKDHNSSEEQNELLKQQNIDVAPHTPGDHVCQFCERTFATATSLFWHIDRYHAQLHANLPNNFCIVCNKEFSEYAALHRHLTSVHSLETATCKICMKEFKSAINLQNHIRITHAPPEAIQNCEICQKSFKCALHLRMHMLAVHAGGEYPCDICQKTFSSTKYLNKHKKSHIESRNYQCDICLKMYKNVNAVNKHKKQVHNGVKCTICNIKQANIVDHLKKCHPELSSSQIEIDEIVCSKCNKKIDSIEFSKHEGNCEGMPTVEVTIKTEVLDEVADET